MTQSKSKVVITERLDEACAEWLAQRCEVVRHAYDAPGFDHAIADADGLVVRTYTIINDAFLDKAPNVKVIGRAGVGLDNFDLQACQQRNVRVVYTPDANTQAVVEYAWGLILDHVRPRTNLTPGNAASFHELRKIEVGRQVDTMTLGIFGLGRIGKRMANVAHALGVRVLATDVLPEEELRASVKVPFGFVSAEKLLEQSDIVTVHVDGRPENRKMFDADLLSHLRDDAMFINAARGMLVDDQALLAWLQAHPNGSAVLDVHDPEPVPADHPLLSQPNARLLPHLASRTDPALANMSWVVRDVWAVLDGQEPAYPAPCPT